MTPTLAKVKLSCPCPPICIIIISVLSSTIINIDDHQLSTSTDPIPSKTTMPTHQHQQQAQRRGAAAVARMEAAMGLTGNLPPNNPEHFGSVFGSPPTGAAPPVPAPTGTTTEAVPPVLETTTPPSLPTLADCATVHPTVTSRTGTEGSGVALPGATNTRITTDFMGHAITDQGRAGGRVAGRGRGRTNERAGGRVAGRGRGGRRTNGRVGGRGRVTGGSGNGGRGSRGRSQGAGGRGDAQQQVLNNAAINQTVNVPADVLEEEMRNLEQIEGVHLMDDEAINADIQHVLRSRIAKKTRENYTSYSIRLLLFLFDHHERFPDMIRPSLFEALRAAQAEDINTRTSGGKPSKRRLRVREVARTAFESIESADVSTHPIILENMRFRTLGHFFSTFNKRYTRKTVEGQVRVVPFRVGDNPEDTVDVRLHKTSYDGVTSALANLDIECKVP